MPLQTEHIVIIRRFAGTIVPPDEDPGANDVPVAEMIAAVVASWPPEQAFAFQTGLELADQFALSLFGEPIATLPESLFAELVAAIAAAPEWAEFWQGLRSLVCLNFYALPQAYLPLGMPGPSIDSGGIPL
jgi:hypothetical protein